MQIARCTSCKRWFKEITLNTDYPSAYSATNPWSGDRVLSLVKVYKLKSNTLNIASTSNAADFGNLSLTRSFS